MALAVTESWIKERVRLSHNNLEDVRSLSLPGTYHEKISTLGESLRNFSRLKSLDLSRNAIESLQGLENLKMLEKLTLYYNNVPSLQELYRLRYNQRLQELDLRLNPVARSEPDYRLFLIHMLPNLRRLDDRAVRDSERKAALMHFTTDQASQMSQHHLTQHSPQQAPNPRTELVKSLARPPSAVDRDEAVLLDFAGKTTAELLAPKKITGSANTKPSVEEYPDEVARQMDRSHAEDSHQLSLAESLPFPQSSLSKYAVNQEESLPQTTAATSQSMSSKSSSVVSEPGAVLLPQVAEDLQKKYPNLMGPVLLQISEDKDDKQYGYQLQVPKNHGQNGDSEDINLKYQDEIEAYTSYKAQGHFTPHPDQVQCQPSAEDKVEKSSSGTKSKSVYHYESPVMSASAELYSAENNQQEVPPSGSKLQSPDGADVGSAAKEVDDQVSEPFVRFLTEISTLVDKYWNGSKSLLKNSRFKSHLSSIYQELTASVQPSTLNANDTVTSQELAKLRHWLRDAEEENKRLRERPGMGAGEETKDKGPLIRAQRDLSLLRGRLQKSLEENKALQNKIAAMETGHHRHGNGENSSPTETELDSIELQNERLQNEIISLNIRLKQASQMQELAAMLQESHKSLVETNDHLLRELEETRQRHAAEIKQLQWNYDQLKKSVIRSQYMQEKTYNGSS